MPHRDPMQSPADEDLSFRGDPETGVSGLRWKPESPTDQRDLEQELDDGFVPEPDIVDSRELENLVEGFEKPEIENQAAAEASARREPPELRT